MFPNFGGTNGGSAVLALYVVSSTFDATAMAAYLAPFGALGGAVSVTPGVAWPALADVTDGATPPALTGPTGPKLWEYKLGAVVDRPLSNSDFGSIVDTLLEPIPSPTKVSRAFFAYLEPYEGAMVSGGVGGGSANANATSFSHRSVGFDLVFDIFAFADAPGGSAVALDYLRTLYSKKWGSFTSGAYYQNYPNPFLLQPARRALDGFYGAGNVCALSGVKRRYDPSNVFATQLGVPTSVKGC